MSNLLHNTRHTVGQAKADVQGRAQEWMGMHTRAGTTEMQYVDVSIQFIGASGIPKMDVVGTADPYFVAKLDGNLSFVFVVSRVTFICDTSFS